MNLKIRSLMLICFVLALIHANSCSPWPELRPPCVFVYVTRATSNSLNLHVFDYLTRYGYRNAAQGLEQDVPELSQRPTLPLNSNFLIDNWQQFWDNHQARARKQANAMPPQYMDVRDFLRWRVSWTSLEQRRCDLDKSEAQSHVAD